MSATKAPQGGSKAVFCSFCWPHLEKRMGNGRLGGKMGLSRARTKQKVSMLGFQFDDLGT